MAGKSITGIPDSLLSSLSEDETLFGILTKSGEELAEALKQSLADKGASDVGTLEQSIRFELEPIGEGRWRFQIMMADYARYIDLGVKGIGGRRAADSKFSGKKGQSFTNKAPSSPFSFKRSRPLSGEMFKGWAQRKSLSPWAVAQAVWRTGIKPNHFITKVFNKKYENALIKLLEKAGAKEIEVGLAKMIEGKWRSQ